MAYTNLNFVPGEILTAAKMNLLATNDASFRDGTGILDNSIQASKLKVKIQSGETIAVFQQNNTGGGFSVVNFPTQFQNVPSIMATPHLTTGYLGSIMITDVSRSSFTYLARTQGPNVNGRIRWLAVSLSG